MARLAATGCFGSRSLPRAGRVRAASATQARPVVTVRVDTLCFGADALPNRTRHPVSTRATFRIRETAEKS